MTNLVLSDDLTKKFSGTLLNSLSESSVWGTSLFSSSELDVTSAIAASLIFAIKRAVFERGVSTFSSGVGCGLVKGVGLGVICFSGGVRGVSDSALVVDDIDDKPGRVGDSAPPEGRIMAALGLVLAIVKESRRSSRGEERAGVLS